MIIVHGKTGWRRIRLVSSVPHLSNWLEHHPLKDNPEVPLWVGMGTKNHNKPMSYDCLRMLLRKIAKRAGVRKDVNPHNFRHSRATDLANWMTEAQMDKFFGWVIGSKMASVYIHLSGRDIDEVILKIHVKIKEETHEQLKPKTCPICGHENAPEAELCLKCRRPLSVKAVLEAEERERELLKMITPEKVEKMVQKKVEEILSRYLPQGQAQPQRIKVMV